MIDIACMRVCTEQEGRLKCVSSLVRIHDFDVFVCDESLMMPDTIVKPKVGTNVLIMIILLTSERENHVNF